MKTVYQEAYINAMHFWVKYVKERQKRVPADELEYYRIWKSKFDNWALRNIDNVNQPKMKGDDIHEGFLGQVQWLKAAGFIKVDVFISATYGR